MNDPDPPTGFDDDEFWQRWMTWQCHRLAVVALADLLDYWRTNPRGDMSRSQIDAVRAAATILAATVAVEP